MLINLFLFVVGGIVLWFASAMVVRGVQRFSHSVHVSTFATSFLILGILTSITEISVGINSVLDRRPEIFVGNLIGGSFVILLLIIPLVAIFGRGITLAQHLQPQKLSFFLALIAAPSFLILDGYVSRYDALLVILFYLVFFNLFRKSEKILDEAHLNPQGVRKAEFDLAKIVIGAVLIYIASKILVDKTIYFAQFLSIPPFLISLLLLSVGTNLPELTIAANSIRQKHKEIAFGDYVGSAATNSLLFGIFTLIHGPFALNSSGFDFTFLVLLFGYLMFFLFAYATKRLSPQKGLVLILIYLVFVLIQVTEIFFLSPKI